MALKLGEMMIQEGVITPEELEEALRYQVIYGGRLGTNLIEMGLVEEGDIALTLSRKLRVPYVDPEQLMNIPESILRLVPRDMVEKFKVIPLRQEQKKLTLVMADPSNLPAIDEISFRTGFIIRPVVTPEVRLILALEKYYQIPRELRYVMAIGRISTKGKPGPARPAPTRTGQPARENVLAPLAEADLAEIEEVVNLAAAELIEDLPDAEIIDRYTPDSVSRELAEAGDRDRIAEILVGFLGQEFSRCALFLVKEGVAAGWKARLDENPVEGFEQVHIPLDEPSVLQVVAQSRSYYLGPVPANRHNSRIFQNFGGKLPETALFVPLLMMGRAVAVLFVDRQGIALGERIFELQKLTAKAAMSFEILILKNKILMM